MGRFVVQYLDENDRGCGSLDWCWFMLPQILNIAVWLTPLAAVGAVCTMIGAIVLHIRRKDGAEAIATNLFIIALAIFVAYNRSGLIG